MRDLLMLFCFVALLELSSKNFIFGKSLGREKFEFMEFEAVNGHIKCKNGL